MFWNKKKEAQKQSNRLYTILGNICENLIGITTILASDTDKIQYLPDTEELLVNGEQVKIERWSATYQHTSPLGHYELIPAKIILVVKSKFALTITNDNEPCELELLDYSTEKVHQFIRDFHSASVEYRINRVEHLEKVKRQRELNEAKQRAEEELQRVERQEAGIQLEQMFKQL